MPQCTPREYPARYTDRRLTAPVVKRETWVRANAPEMAILCVLAARLWLMVMPSSLWTDETVTAFAARYPAHPSLAIVPPYTQSIYYLLPRAMDALFGFSEIGYRIPSVLAMGLALFFVARLAARIIDPQAAWFAAFACLAIPGIDYFAIDAKPYALGMCFAAAALYCLVRWLDSSRWIDAAMFVVAAALLWRVQEVYWPLYLVFGIYAMFRMARRETRVGWARFGAVAAVLALTLTPVALQAWALFRNAGAHVFVEPPPLLELRRLVRRDWNFIAVCGGLAWLAARLTRSRERWTPQRSAAVLALAWWLITPLGVFVFSRLSGTSLFVPRYLSLSLPGIAMTATLAAALYIPRRLWRTATLAIAAGALVFAGNWNSVWPEHDPAGWRSPAEYVNRIAETPDTPIICISPFIEAIPPVWSPDYPIPGFLYAPLFAYPLRGTPYLFPVRVSDEARLYAQRLIPKTLPHHGLFLIYGGIPAAQYWQNWLSQVPELHGWRSDARDFGDILVVVFRAHPER